MNPDAADIPLQRYNRRFLIDGIALTIIVDELVKNYFTFQHAGFFDFFRRFSRCGKRERGHAGDGCQFPYQNPHFAPHLVYYQLMMLCPKRGACKISSLALRTQQNAQ
ncbi:hypothetical protein [Sphingomonas sp. 32-62-10]|uniref:hypothetical protein n=1 Tax=Sphingomonas sp. 32-62-10 TaxID=1970436 RepID=UPI0035A8C8DD